MNPDFSFIFLDVHAWFSEVRGEFVRTYDLQIVYFGLSSLNNHGFVDMIILHFY